MTWILDIGDISSLAQPLAPSAFAKRWTCPVLVELPPGATFRGAGTQEEVRLRALEHLGDLRMHVLMGDRTPISLGRQGDLSPLAREGVSVEHLHLVCEEGRWRVLDLDGRGQTSVAGRAVPAERSLGISPGQVLRVGSAEFAFFGPKELYRLAHAAVAGGPPMTFPRGGVLLSKLIEMEAHTWVGPESGPFLIEVPVDEQHEALMATLVVAEGSIHEKKRACDLDRARIHSLAREGEVRIGRGDDVEVFLHDRSVSRVHARMWCAAQQARVLDEESKNGTWVTSGRLPPGIMEEVQVGQPIRFSRALCTMVDWARLRELACRITSSATSAA